VSHPATFRRLAAPTLLTATVSRQPTALPTLAQAILAIVTVEAQLIWLMAAIAMTTASALQPIVLAMPARTLAQPPKEQALMTMAATAPKPLTVNPIRAQAMSAYPLALLGRLMLLDVSALRTQTAPLGIATLPTIPVSPPASPSTLTPTLSNATVRLAQTASLTSVTQDSVLLAAEPFLWLKTVTAALTLTVPVATALIQIFVRVLAS